MSVLEGGTVTAQSPIPVDSGNIHNERSLTMALPMKLDSLDSGTRAFNGRPYFTLGEFFTDKEGEYRGGTRSLSFDLTSKEHRDALVLWLNQAIKDAADALEKTKSATPPVAQDNRVMPRWKRNAATQNGPVTQVQPPTKSTAPVDPIRSAAINGLVQS